jgi:hypothetical protein
MIRVFQIAVFSCAVTSLIGCNVPEKDKPIWQQVKFGDLAPSANDKRSAGQLLKTINFSIYLFEIPAGNIGILDDVWPMPHGSDFPENRKMGYLYRKPLRFNDSDAFGANSFLIGFGQLEMWDKIADLLRSADAKKIETVSLLLLDGQANDLTITALDNEQMIFYASAGGAMEAVGIGPGKLLLRIKAEKIPGSRGICNVDIQPVFSSPAKSSIPQLAARKKSHEFVFTSAGFKLKMSPGDFVFLGPEKYVSHQVTLGSLFFSKPKPRPVVRTYLIICTRIID